MTSNLTDLETESRSSLIYVLQNSKESVTNANFSVRKHGCSISSGENTVLHAKALALDRAVHFFQEIHYII